MAGDWLAMRLDLEEEPEVVEIVSAMCPDSVRDLSKRMRHVSLVCGALLRTWRLFDKLTSDGILRGYTADWLDGQVGIPGFAANLQHVGWLIVEPQAIIAPKFTTYMGESAKKRLQDAKRKREQRKSRPVSVRETSGEIRTEIGLQNRTEQIKKKTKKKAAAALAAFSLPENLDTADFRTAWTAWLKHRTEIRKPLTPTQAAHQLAQFAAWGPARAIAAIRHTVTMGWQGLREEAVNGQPGAAGAAGAGPKKPAAQAAAEWLADAAEAERRRERRKAERLALNAGGNP